MALERLPGRAEGGPRDLADRRETSTSMKASATSPGSPKRKNFARAMRKATAEPARP
ncbi:MAG: hypothetical protein MZW92_01600 [Comamonadaceae bacterium]|nr:hypothetical protein [Comamonadaceae bacterium]